MLITAIKHCKTLTNLFYYSKKKKSDIFTMEVDLCVGKGYVVLLNIYLEIINFLRRKCKKLSRIVADKH